MLARQHETACASRVDTSFRMRTREEIARLSDGLTLAEPGLV